MLIEIKVYNNYNLGVALERKKNFEEATACYKLAIEYGDPESDEIKGWIGSIRVQKGISWLFGS